MIYKGFIGPPYRSRSIAASGDRLVNLFPESIESGNGKNAWVFYYTPGIAAFCDASAVGHPVRALFQTNGRAFAVVGAYLIEVLAGGTYTSLGSVTNPQPVESAQIVANGYQLLIRSGTSGFIFDMNTNVLTPLAGWLDGVGASGIGMINNYFLATQKNTRYGFFSALNDGLEWDPLDFITKEGGGDNIVGMAVNQRQWWLFGSATAEVWYNSGSENIFDYIQGAFLQCGTNSRDSIRVMDNSVFWIQQDERGPAMVVRAQGYTAKRISNHALEYAMQSYSTVADAIAYSYQEQGHTFYVLTFPTANATWVYDAASQQWHERSYWDQVHAESRAVRQRTHAYIFGKHLVGDSVTGMIYEQSMSYATDNSAEIRRIRQAPVLADEMRMMSYGRLMLDVQHGVDVPPAGQGSAPLYMLRYSNDGGYTWSNELQARGGALGQYGYRTFWDRLGSDENRVFEVSASDPLPGGCWINAYLNTQQGNGR